MPQRFLREIFCMSATIKQNYGWAATQSTRGACDKGKRQQHLVSRVESVVQKAESKVVFCEASQERRARDVAEAADAVLHL